MTLPCWLRRAVRNRHRHAIEQAPRRWRGGRRDDSARTRRKILISTQAHPRGRRRITRVVEVRGLLPVLDAAPAGTDAVLRRRRRGKRHARAPGPDEVVPRDPPRRSRARRLLVPRRGVLPGGPRRTEESRTRPRGPEAEHYGVLRAPPVSGRRGPPRSEARCGGPARAPIGRVVDAPRVELRLREGVVL